ncbi:MAG TPA: molybdopterin-dependent oxidoreductase, partial [Peptococcaceae bacterium]|nr:molybdopterin-dependent oxidoreductase [Peptococcaceae bacterium]
FYLGYGLQRYVNGGRTVRAIDALAALSGNIGCSGGGVFYAHQYHKENLNSLLLPPGNYQNRTFPHATLAAELLKKENEPRPELAFVTRTNPLVTQPDTDLWRKLWSAIPFKVTLERRWSETALQSDLVLPVTTIFEEEDLLATSWSTFIHYARPILKPRGEARSEARIFTELAQRLGLQAYFPYTPTEWLEYILEPWREAGLTLENLRQGPLRAPYIPQVAWQDKKFRTKSGKIELITKEEFLSTEDGPVENYFRQIGLAGSNLFSTTREGYGSVNYDAKSSGKSDEVLIEKSNVNTHEYSHDNNIVDIGAKIDERINENIDENSAELQALNSKIFDFSSYTGRKCQVKKRAKEHCYVLLTPHPDMALHSQFQEEEIIRAYLHPATAAYQGIADGDEIVVEGEKGEIIATAVLTPVIHELTIVIPEGCTVQAVGVNNLIPGRLSSMGENTAYYDTFCWVRRREKKDNKQR